MTEGDAMAWSLRFAGVVTMVCLLALFTSCGSESTPDLDSRAGDSGTPDTEIQQDADTHDTVPCSYAKDTEEHPVAVKCGPTHKLIYRHISSPPDTSCPEYWSIDGSGSASTHANPAAAATAEGCSADCIWKLFKAVTVVHCGQKIGYEILTATNCVDLYHFPDGFYPSYNAYASAHPCS
jgi:hypothetical protein